MSIAVKVLVFLTMPIDPSSNQVSLQVEYLQHFRAALLDDDTIPVIMSLLEDPLQRLERCRLGSGFLNFQVDLYDVLLACL